MNTQGCDAHKWNRLQAALAGLTIGLIGLAGAVSAHAEPPKDAPPPAPKADQPAEKMLDELILTNGNKIVGEIMEENDSSVTIKIVVGTISAPRTFPRSEILQINRAAVKAAGGKDEPKKELTKKDDPKATDDPNAPKVYVIHMRGEFGRDVTHTPMAAVVEDMKKHQPDIMVLEFDNSFSRYEDEVPDFVPDGRKMYDQLETAREIETILTDKIRDDPGFTKKPRLVGWIKKALGGAAFMPFVCPELYYHPEAHHGGIGYLEHMFDGVGDERAREKQYSLRLARAVGVCEKGGYDGKIMWAMSRTDYILSYRLVGGKAEFLPQMPVGPDEFLLTDDGKDERMDLMPDVVRYKGNDVLTLDAVTAQRIGVSRGTVSSIDELMFALGVPRNYVLVKGQQDEVLSNWGEQVTKAENDIRKLLREFQQVKVKDPGGYQERTAARGKRKQLLLQIKSLIDRYGEAINPRKVGSPEGLLQQIERVIYQIETEQRLDKPEKR